MSEPLAPQYNPKDIETRWSELWASTSLLHATPDPHKKPYTIVIPPPNVTGILHMGHALNNTIQDILIRVRRMQGRQALWMPGTDHAGIATQNVVERKLAKEGKTRRDLGREAFVDQVWAWKKEYGSTIIRQLKRMGATCDWPRERFTMDEGYSEAVRDVFVRLYEKGLIYQGDYIINWCPRCQTALADEEAPHKDLDGKLYYIKYPLKQPPAKSKSKKPAMDGVVVATTRPETMLGDTAVAVHPTDKRYKALIGATLVLPLVEREIRIISDRLIDKKFGTGAVKVTPAHDPNDYLMGRSHNLEFINIMNPDGVLNANAGEYAGMDRFEAREAIIEELKERKLLVKIEEHRHAVGHCYRCHTIIEPYLSKQWFVKMAPLARPAIRAVKKNDIRFTPKRWTKVYLNWMENIKDWCISRQIWWGHRLPVWYCDACLKKSKGVIVSRTTPAKCPDCGNTALRQDEDVLDTWFSSWLWPFATFGWPREGQKDLGYFYPTDTLVTAPEIIFFWVARMIMAGFEFMGQKPFGDVYIHGTVRDEEGKKMSKSLGNSIDPLEIIEQYGADALRFSLIAIAASGSDIFLSTERFEQGRNFCNKIWNASRFILMNLKEGVTGDAIDSASLKLQDKWILSELNDLIRKTDKAIDAFKFNEAVNLLYGFFWHSFCDWYLEAAKSDIDDKNTQEVLMHVLKSVLSLLHPFMPFITEEIATRLPGRPQETLALAPWPTVDKPRDDKACARSIKLAFETVSFLRLKRHDLQVPVTTKIRVAASVKTKEARRTLESVLPLIKRMAQIETWTFLEDDASPQDALSGLVGKDLRLFLLLEGLVDVAREKERLDQEITSLSGLIRQKEGLLANKGFVQRAPSDVVEKETAKLQELKAKRTGLQEVRHAFK
jgi:valyl-tRNA synthetase